MFAHYHKSGNQLSQAMLDDNVEELLKLYRGESRMLSERIVIDVLELLVHNAPVNNNQASREELALMFVHKLMDTHPLKAAVDAAYTLADEIIEQRHI